MNGATAELSAKIINTPKRRSKIMIGASHHFLRSIKKFQNSLIIDILLIKPPRILKLLLVSLLV